MFFLYWIYEVFEKEIIISIPQKKRNRAIYTFKRRLFYSSHIFFVKQKLWKTRSIFPFFPMTCGSTNVFCGETKYPLLDSFFLFTVGIMADFTSKASSPPVGDVNTVNTQLGGLQIVFLWLRF